MQRLVGMCYSLLVAALLGMAVPWSFFFFFR